MGKRRRRPRRPDAARRAPAEPLRSVEPDGARPPVAGDLLALLVALPAVIPFLLPGWFFGHDNMHLIRLFEQDIMVRAGEFPVRWYPDVAGGYGSPHPQFYAPLFYLLAQVFHLVGVPLAGSLKAAVGTVVLLSSLGMYRLARVFFGSGAALVAAAAYTYAPYHLLDLFVRTAFSEVTVFAFLPFVLLAFYRLALEVTPLRIAAAAAALGALCLSHTITVMLIPPLLGGYVLLLAWQAGFRRSFLLGAIAAGLLGILLSAFFLVPLVAEKGFVDTEIYALGYFDYKKHFPTLGQLISSPWGFGMSREGVEDDGISFRLGFLQMLGCVVVLAGRRRLRAALPGAYPHILFAAALAAAGIFMSLSISSPVWALVPPIRFVQFPWRFLMLPAFGMPFLCAAAAAIPWLRKGAGAATSLPRSGRAPSESRPGAAAPVPRWAVALACLLLTGVGIEMIGFRKRIPLERIGFGGDHTDMRERTPEAAAMEPTVFTREFIRKSTLHWFDHVPHGGYPYPPRRDLERPRAELVRGSADISAAEESPVRYSVKVRARAPSTVRLNVYRFPGWTWRLDGVEAPPAPFPGKRPVQTLEIPPGEHEAVAVFERTGPRWAGDLASLSSLLAVAGLAAAGIRRGRSRDSDGSAGR